MKSPGLIRHVMDMPRLRAAIGSLLFLFIAPGTVAGLVPWWLTGWAIHDWPQPYATPLRLVGAVLIVLGHPRTCMRLARTSRSGVGVAGDHVHAAPDPLRPRGVAPPEHF